MPCQAASAFLFSLRRPRSRHAKTCPVLLESQVAIHLRALVCKPDGNGHVIKLPLSRSGHHAVHNLASMMRQAN